MLNKRCPVCGNSAREYGHQILVVGHDRKNSMSWPIHKVARQITNMAVREVRDGEVLHARMLPVVSYAGRRFVVVDQWRKSEQPEHVIFVPSELADAPRAVVEDIEDGQPR